ncbi:hypothetical protein DRJ17_03460 [Candidatus Woesearchaeota archaeon]|nr:MAG: hypothetical protein DRJ17_03460 [Candidatus Woesearchaeota archaeon]
MTDTPDFEYWKSKKAIENTLKKRQKIYNTDSMILRILCYQALLKGIEDKVIEWQKKDNPKATPKFSVDYLDSLSKEKQEELVNLIENIYSIKSEPGRSLKKPYLRACAQLANPPKNLDPQYRDFKKEVSKDVQKYFENHYMIAIDDLKKVVGRENFGKRLVDILDEAARNLDKNLHSKVVTIDPFQEEHVQASLELFKEKYGFSIENVKKPGYMQMFQYVLPELMQLHYAGLLEPDLGKKQIKDYIENPSDIKQHQINKQRY